MAYTPPAEILEKYAQVLINFALGGGTGIKPGEAVMIQLPECAKPLYVPLRDTVLKAGGHPFMFFSADDVQPGNVYSLASDEQLIYFAASFYKGIVEQFDHRVAIIAESDKYELKDVDPKKLMLRSNSAKQ